MMLNDVDDAFDLLERRGGGAYGLSDVTQLEHALQAAALAEARDLSPALVIAALFHDIGHLLPAEDVALADRGVDDVHEIAGAEMLTRLFGPDVVEPIRLHVPAKRWLCYVEPGYFDRLAADSVRSLVLQGGSMSGEESAEFARQPHASAAADLRRIDDEAKVQGLQTPGLDAYREAARRLARSDR